MKEMMEQWEKDTTRDFVKFLAKFLGDQERQKIQSKIEKSKTLKKMNETRKGARNWYEQRKEDYEPLSDCEMEQVLPDLPIFLEEHKLRKPCYKLLAENEVNDMEELIEHFKIKKMWLQMKKAFVIKLGGTEKFEDLTEALRPYAE